MNQLRRGRTMECPMVSSGTHCCGSNTVIFGRRYRCGRGWGFDVLEVVRNVRHGSRHRNGVAIGRSDPSHFLN